MSSKCLEMSLATCCLAGWDENFLTTCREDIFDMLSTCCHVPEQQSVFKVPSVTCRMVCWDEIFWQYFGTTFLTCCKHVGTCWDDMSIGRSCQHNMTVTFPSRCSVLAKQIVKTSTHILYVCILVTIRSMYVSTCCGMIFRGQFGSGSFLRILK